MHVATSDIARDFYVRRDRPSHELGWLDAISGHCRFVHRASNTRRDREHANAYSHSHCYMTVSTITAQYFSKKRGIANGIIYAGGGLGGAVTSLAMERLIEEVGPAWTFRVIGLLTLGTCLPAAWLLKERTSIQSKKFIDWWDHPPLSQQTMLTPIAGAWPKIIASSPSSLPGP